jgi:autotransporter passenger strand-loop-strand repeat protein
MTNTTVSSGVTSSGIALTVGDTMTVLSGGTAIGAVDSGGTVTVSAGGTASGTTVIGQSATPGGELVSGGTAINTVVGSGGHESVFFGGTTIGTTVNSGGAEYVFAGSTASGTVLNGGFESVEGTATSAIVNSAGSAFVSSGGGDMGTTVNNGGHEDIFSGGTANGVTVNSGGTETVHSGGRASHTTLNGTTTLNGIENVFSGGTIIGAVLNGVVSALVEGTAFSDIVNSGGEEHLFSGGTDVGTTVNNGGKLFVGDGVNNSGTANGVTVNSGGIEYVHTGGTASSTTLNGGAEEVFSGGTAFGTTVNNGGVEYVFSGGTTIGTTVNSGGIEYVNFDRTTNGVATTAIGTTVNSGGIENVYAGGTASGTTIATWGTLHIFNGGTAANGILFSGSNATLIIDGTTMPTTTISGLASSDSIVLSNFAYNATDTVSISGNSVTVAGPGGASETLTIAGAANDKFTLSSASGGGTTITSTAAVVPAPSGLTLAPGSDSGTPGDNITNVTTPVITGTGVAGDTIALYDGQTLVGSATVGADGSWSVTTSTLAEGTNSLTATQTDGAGNVSSTSTALTLTIDTAADSVTAALKNDTGASSTDTITRDATLTGTADANSTIVLMNGTTQVGSGTADATGEWTITPTGLANGTYTLTVNETDVAGNTASTTTSFTLDTAIPAAPAGLTLAPGSDSGTPGDNITNVTTPVITGTGVAGDTIALYDGQTLVGSATVRADSIWSVTTSTLTAGTNSLTAKQTDVAGNVSSASTALTLTIIPASDPPTAPTITTVSEITNGNTPLISGTGAAGDTVTLFDGSTNIGAGVVTAGGVWSITPSTGLTENFSTITATQTDAAGNTSAASNPINMFVVPVPVNGISTTDLSSADIGAVLAQGYRPSFISGTEAVTLVDGTISVGPDTQEATIQRLYEGLLGRPGEVSGVAAYDRALNAGMPKAQAAAIFLSSPEYTDAHGTMTDAQFVNSLYQGFLGRAPDSSGGSAFTAALDSGALTRAQTVIDIADSPEAKTHLAGTTSFVWVPSPTGAEANELYKTALGRNVDVGTGVNIQTDLNAGMPFSQIVQMVVGSPEYQADHFGQTNTQLVASLYENGLGRAPDPAGGQAWMNFLNAGGSQAQLIVGIATSPEAQAHLTTAL